MDSMPNFESRDITGQIVNRAHLMAMAPVLVALLRGVA